MTVDRPKMANHEHLFRNFVLLLCIFFIVLPLQLTIEASDQALPDDQVTAATVVITVPRDQQPPSFERPEMTAQTSETRNIGETILNFRARDNNLAVCLNFHANVLNIPFFKCFKCELMCVWPGFLFNLHRERWSMK